MTFLSNRVFDGTRQKHTLISESLPGFSLSGFFNTFGLSLNRMSNCLVFHFPSAIHWSVR
jgi:hypothetical protein